MFVSNTDITESLKTALKSRGVTYKQLATDINVSEQTIKRLFKDKDCSISRLAQICEVINLPMADLLDFSGAYSQPMGKLSEQQQQFLADNPGHFAFIFLLTVGYRPQQIQQHYALSDLGVFRYLSALDKQGFLELGAHNHVRLLVEGKLLIPLHGPLHELIKASNTTFLHHVIDQDSHDHMLFKSAFRHMSAETVADLHEDIHDLIKKYIKLANRDEAVLPKNQLLPIKFIAAAGEFDLFEHWHIPEPKT